MQHSWSRQSFLVLASLAVLTAGCSNNPIQPPSPGIEPEVVNNIDVFQLQVTAVQNYTGVAEYAWNNTGTLANIDQSCSIPPGQATLIILDANGAQVYSQDLATDGSFASAAGASGNWQVRVVMTSMTGTLNFRAEKRTP